MVTASEVPPVQVSTSRSALHRAATRPWTVASPAPPEFMAAVGYLHPVAAQVLYNRGLTSAAAVQAFLAAETAPLHDPRMLHGMDRAITRIRRALASGETIAVHGDFDVDGVTATGILTEGLRAAARAAGSAARVIPFLPQRSTTGYGMHVGAIERLAAEGARLIVTGDTGTRALGAVQRAVALGVDVIVTDHHVPGDATPAAVALVNPHQAPCPYPFKLLSGAGVAWKLIHALALEGLLDEAAALSLLDLVALGTIVDVSPLLGENRALVRRGLRHLCDAPRPGIQALLATGSNGRAAGSLDERTVAFSIGPRLNAAGRMDDPSLALELLLTPDARRAAELVGILEEKNQERRVLTERVLVAARAQAERLASQPILVLRGQDWPGGVIGLVAARIAEEYGRPAFIIEERPDACRGSGRTVDGFDLVGALSRCADLLIEYGGHPLAAGFAVHTHLLDELVERLLAAAAERVVPVDEPIVADCALPGTGIDWPLYQALTRLRPFGAGHPEPLFLTREVPVVEARAVGADARHLRLRLRVGRQTLTAFGPEMGSQAPWLTSAGRIDVLYTIGISTWNGHDSLELRLHAARPAHAHRV